ncbi:uncharacterized protein [Ambystoma mexicanum]
MMELHRALISLGPLIATTVFSLRSKEKQELFPQDNQTSERRSGTNTSQDKEPASIYIDHLGAEVGESSTASSSGHDIFSIHIKDEEETYCMDYDNSLTIGSISHNTAGPDAFSFPKKEKEETHYVDHNENARKGSSSPLDERIRKRKRKTGFPVESAGNIVPCKDLYEGGQVEVRTSTEAETQSCSQLWSERARELEGEKSAQCESGFMYLQHPCSYPETLDIEKSSAYNHFNSNRLDENLLCRPNTQSYVRPYACPDCQKLFKTNQDLTRHQRIHSGERPYHCTECGKRFSRRHHLIGHQRTHTGEKPYQCPQCDRTFSLKENRRKHQRTHMQEEQRNF